MSIKLLSQNLINQIAAGEVIERPSSTIKELMENAIDAGATEIIVKVINAGKNFISVSDDGCGMDKESIELCILSHATSKLSTENLFDIHTFGFRGEALPSIAAVSRLSVTSSDNASSEAWTLNLEGGKSLGLSPANRRQGTTIEVRDLFFATPARLKFLKSDSSELDSCCEVFNRFALAFPNITFRFFDGNREKYFYAKAENYSKRVEDVIGESFAKNTFKIEAQNDKLRLRGFIGIPTFNKASACGQYFFVNNRFVKDKIFAYALKSAYSGLVPQGRYAAAVLFLDIPFDEVDVNAHPAKIEIRFKDGDRVRFFILSELKKAISAFGAQKPTTELVDNFMKSNFRQHSAAETHNTGAIAVPRITPEKQRFSSVEKKRFPSSAETTAGKDFFGQYSPHQRQSSRESCNIPLAESTKTSPIPAEESNLSGNFLLGNAVHQVCNTYIIAGNEDNLIIVDQHAAAERITLERLKNNISLESQTLLLPEVCHLTESQIELLEKSSDLMLKFGIHYEKLAKDLISVNAIPAILESCDAKSLMNDIVEEMAAFGDAYTIEEKIHKILSTISCHGSLRAGKKLTIAEMNHLLRQMEKTENIAQCCHGRPSYIMLSQKNLDKFFERA